MLSILISRPIHIRSQCEPIIVSIVPVKIEIIISGRIVGLTSMGRM